MKGNPGNKTITIFDYSVTSERAHASSSAPLLNAEVNRTNITSIDLVIMNNRGEIEIE
jgi:hypothetical protein